MKFRQCFCHTRTDGSRRASLWALALEIDEVGAGVEDLDKAKHLRATHAVQLWVILICLFAVETFFACRQLMNWSSLALGDHASAAMLTRSKEISL